MTSTSTPNSTSTSTTSLLANRVKIAQTLARGVDVPILQFHEDDDYTWGKLYEIVRELYDTHVLKIFKEKMIELNLSETKVPQVSDVNKVLSEKTGWKLHPVTGILTEKEFFSLLSEKYFPCAVNMRNKSSIEFASEPDLCHELLGHAAWFLIPEIAKISQRYGQLYNKYIDQVKQRECIVRLYFRTLEVGLCKDVDGKMKCIGSGILSSRNEMKRSLDLLDLHRELDFAGMIVDIADTENLQTYYYYGDSLTDLINKSNHWLDEIENGTLPSEEMEMKNIV